MTGRLETVGRYAILVLFTVIAIYPLIGVVSMSLRPPETVSPAFGLPDSLDVGSFARAWEQGRFGTYLRNSVIVTSAVVVLTAVLSILAGYAFGMMRFRGSRALFYAVLLGLIVPTEAMIVPLYYDLRSVGLTDTYLGLILPQVGSLVAFGTFWMRAFFRSAPLSLVEAARLEGASSWTILWRVLLPVGRPAVLTLVVLTFLWSWNEFYLALVMISDEDLRTAPLGLNFFQGRRSSNYSLLAAGSVIVALPVLITYVFLQRHFIRGMLAGAIKA